MGVITKRDYHNSSQTTVLGMSGPSRGNRSSLNRPLFSYPGTAFTLYTSYIPFYCYNSSKAVGLNLFTSKLTDCGGFSFPVGISRRILRGTPPPWTMAVDGIAVDNGSQMDPSIQDEPIETPFIKLATYNIQSGRRGRLEMALREMDQMNIDIGILTETKLTAGIYTRYSSGYHVRATEASSHNKGGVALFWRDRPNWSVESERCHGPNVISCELKTGGRRHLIIGAYISPSEEDGSTCTHIVAARERCTSICALVLGDFNVDLANPGITTRDADVIGCFSNLGLDNMVEHYRLSHRHREGFTWKQYRQGELITSRCDGLLADCRRDFLNVQIRSPRGLLSDHGALLGWICAGPAKGHKGYLHARKTIPWTPPASDKKDISDYRFECLMQKLRRTRPPPREHKPWISDETWSQSCRCWPFHRGCFRSRSTPRGLEHCQSLVPPSKRPCPQTITLGLQGHP